MKITLLGIVVVVAAAIVMLVFGMHLERLHRETGES